MRVAIKSTNKFRSFSMVSVAFVLTVLLVRDLVIHKKGAGIEDMLFSRGNKKVSSLRKLVQYEDDGKVRRKGMVCSKEEIVIYEGEVPPLPSGIPAYTVQIMNMCASDCKIAKIHLHCGWFSSARLINPRVFRRLGYDDCLVNDGKVLGPGKTISFQYANTFRYPLSVASVVCSS
ncbi:hypothetical protein VNO78_22467 [Psophocarpus tetragonolobus]|uniref:Uncharacterized protein n=1 Tax=Psophocarpus tetragonolobus TaxID=3891 RepID=A0AAN9S214_PSOTE